MIIMILIAFIFCAVTIGASMMFLKSRKDGYGHWVVKKTQSRVIASTIIALLVFGGFVGITLYDNYGDTQLITGQVTGKQRVHGHYLDPYECNCYTTCSGSGSSESCSETCSTCYEDRYTVKWDLQSNIGGIRIKSLDQGSKRVYQSPDPSLYKLAYKGQPCSKTIPYVNYLKSSENSIFSKKQTPDNYLKLLVDYPTIHSIYKVNRVLVVGAKIPNINEWTDLTAAAASVIGPQKQANLLFVLINGVGQDYKYALEKHWNGGKKNDITILIGTNGKDIQWANVSMLADNTGNELTAAKIVDSIMSKDILSTAIISDVKNIILQHFDRKAMEDFAYIADEQGPEAPLWGWILYVLLLVVPNIIINRFIN